MRTAKTLIRLGGSESLPGAQSFCWFCHEAAQMSLHFYSLGLRTLIVIYFDFVSESKHNKTNKMTCAPSEDADQPTV